MRPELLTDSPTVDSLRLAAAMRRRFPPHFGPYIESAMWEAIVDYYAASGGHFTEGDHILAPLCPILCICPVRAMAMLC